MSNCSCIYFKNTSDINKRIEDHISSRKYYQSSVVFLRMFLLPIFIFLKVVAAFSSSLSPVLICVTVFSLKVLCGGGGSIFANVGSCICFCCFGNWRSTGFFLLKHQKFLHLSWDWTRKQHRKLILIML